MPVSPLTPLSIKASLRLYYLKQIFNVLINSHNFYTESGASSSLSEAIGYIFDEAPGKPYVFFDKQSEEDLHLNPDKPMLIHFGVAKRDASYKEVVDVGKKLFSFLKEKGFTYDWKYTDFYTPASVLVNMNSLKPMTKGNIKKTKSALDKKDEELFIGHTQDACLYIPKNEDTKEFCWNDNDSNGPEGGYHFYHVINDGESLRDAILRLDQKVWKHITHCEIDMNLPEEDDSLVILEEIYDIKINDSLFGTGPSLYDALRETTEKKLKDPALKKADDVFDRWIREEEEAKKRNRYPKIKSFFSFKNKFKEINILQIWVVIFLIIFFSFNRDWMLNFITGSFIFYCLRRIWMEYRKNGIKSVIVNAFLPAGIFVLFIAFVFHLIQINQIINFIILSVLITIIQTILIWIHKK